MSDLIERVARTIQPGIEAEWDTKDIARAALREELAAQIDRWPAMRRALAAFAREHGLEPALPEET